MYKNALVIDDHDDDAGVHIYCTGVSMDVCPAE